jgi:hypothetical protein
MCDVLGAAQVIQMLDDFFCGFATAEYDVGAAGQPLLVAGGKGISPLFGGEFFWR